MSPSHRAQVAAVPPPAHDCPHDHLVEFYETDEFLVDTVYDFMAPALRGADAAVIVATADHRAQFEVALADGGLDVAELIASGRLMVLDAAELLSTFIVDGSPDEARFAATVGPLLDAASDHGRRGVRVYGEMVALLWDAGNVNAAITLEDHWNALAGTRAFQLLCAYPMSAFNSPESAEAFARICDQHSQVIPSEAFSLIDDASEQQRMVARLQQEAAALRSELEHLRGDRAELAELAYIDPVTGLANRRAFDRDLEREWSLAMRDGVDSFVVVADLDRFKAVNDVHGHAVGDEVLRQFAAALLRAARHSDIVARIGGDEFAVLLIRCDERASHSFKARLQAAVEQLVTATGRPVTCTVGHASMMQSVSPAGALDRADRSMLARKTHRHPPVR